MFSRLVVAAAMARVAFACPDDPELDLCGSDVVVGSAGPPRLSTCVMLIAGLFSSRNAMLLPVLGSLSVAQAAGVGSTTSGTCGAMKALYADAGCCGEPDKVVDVVVVPKATKTLYGANACDGMKPIEGFENTECIVNNTVQALEQAGGNITLGYVGGMDVGNRTPITVPYWQAGLCPVNVHWHLGTEHYSVGEFDEAGVGPVYIDNYVVNNEVELDNSRRLAGAARSGHRCHHYNSSDSKFTKEYAWQHCVNMKVGETYEVHWPHSAMGACGTPHQYQTPFYDGVFCNIDKLTVTQEQIGVQGQVYTIVNDEDYYHPDLIRGMIVDGEYGKDITHYTGSTTGTSRSNQICSKYTPITWQVDRKCHLISASSFDKMCADMKSMPDDMSTDLYPHGSREVVSDILVANNQQRL